MLGRRLGQARGYAYMSPEETKQLEERLDADMMRWEVKRSCRRCGERPTDYGGLSDIYCPMCWLAEGAPEHEETP